MSNEAKFDPFRKELAALCIKHGVVIEGGSLGQECEVVVKDFNPDEHQDVFPWGVEDACKEVKPNE